MAASIVLAVIVAATVTTKVLERRAERDARVVLEQTGVPPGFRHVGTTVRGSVYCFGPCRRVYATSVADMPFLPAIGRITEHLRAKGAIKRCDLMLNCQAPLVPEDCRPFNEGPVCRMSLVVDGRPLLVSVSRTGQPTELELMGRPEKDINLLF
jgi:hypothetical protein